MYTAERMTITAAIEIQKNISFEKPKIMASETRKKDVVMKLNLIDLKEEITASKSANARIQLFCLNTKTGIFQRRTIAG
jgi:hypothetical protein